MVVKIKLFIYNIKVTITRFMCHFGTNYYQSKRSQRGYQPSSESLKLQCAHFTSSNSLVFFLASPPHLLPWAPRGRAFWLSCVSSMTVGGYTFPMMTVLSMCPQCNSLLQVNSKMLLLPHAVSSVFFPPSGVAGLFYFVIRAPQLRREV